MTSIGSIFTLSGQTAAGGTIAIAAGTGILSTGLVIPGVGGELILDLATLIPGAGGSPILLTLPSPFVVPVPVHGFMGTVIHIQGLAVGISGSKFTNETCIKIY